jgi:hypothetical protein
MGLQPYGWTAATVGGLRRLFHALLGAFALGDVGMQ